MALTAEGYEAVGTTLVKHAAQLLASERFDLLVIGEDVTDEEKQWLTSIAEGKRNVATLLACCWNANDEDVGVVTAVAHYLNSRQSTHHRTAAASA